MRRNLLQYNEFLRQCLNYLNAINGCRTGVSQELTGKVEGEGNIAGVIGRTVL